MENKMKTIMIKNIFGYVEKHNIESFIETWKRECYDFYNLAQTKDELDTVNTFKKNVELMAENRFNKIYERQIENPLKIKDEKIMDRTK